MQNRPEIYIIGKFGADMVEKFLKQFNKIDGDEVCLVIDSEGGDSQVLYTIVTLMLTKFQRKNIHSIVLGEAISSAFMLSQLAPVGNRQCIQISLFGSHKGSFIDTDPITGEQRIGDPNDPAHDPLVPLLFDRGHEYYLKYVPTKLEFYHEKMTYFTADTALKYNIVDRVIGYPVITDCYHKEKLKANE